MSEVRFRLGVIAVRKTIDNPWVDHLWSAADVLPAAPETPAGTLLSVEGPERRFYVGAADLVLAVTDTAQYRDNLMQPPPRLWVILREEPATGMVDIVTVTADPMEAEGAAEDQANIVTALPMDIDLAAEVAAFVDAHHVERAFVKRRRKRHLDGEAQT